MANYFAHLRRIWSCPQGFCKPCKWGHGGLENICFLYVIFRSICLYILQKLYGRVCASRKNIKWPTVTLINYIFVWCCLNYNVVSILLCIFLTLFVKYTLGQRWTSTSTIEHKANFRFFQLLGSLHVFKNVGKEVDVCVYGPHEIHMVPFWVRNREVVIEHWKLF